MLEPPPKMLQPLQVQEVLRRLVLRKKKTIMTHMRAHKTRMALT
jgi:hypothetical protein